MWRVHRGLGIVGWSCAEALVALDACGYSTDTSHLGDPSYRPCGESRLVKVWASAEKRILASC